MSLEIIFTSSIAMLYIALHVLCNHTHTLSLFSPLPPSLSPSLCVVSPISLFVTLLLTLIMVQVIINPMNLIQSQVKECMHSSFSQVCTWSMCYEIFPGIVDHMFIYCFVPAWVCTYTGRGEEVLFNEALSLLQLLCRKLIKSMWV